MQKFEINPNSLKKLKISFTTVWKSELKLEFN